MNIHTIKIIAVCMTITYGGCSPTQRIAAMAETYGYSPLTLRGNGFTLTGYENHSPQADSSTLHIYIEGDGLPWITPYMTSNDPTPRNPLMLRLMALDISPSIYLGRPCYNGHANDIGCDVSLWTDRRYSDLVVKTMSSALQNYLGTHHFKKLVFIGHSGGGTLALLLAERFEHTDLAVTIAGNLDTMEWTRIHGFTPLHGSINPATQRKMRPFKELHFLGAEDTTLPLSIFEPIARKRLKSSIIIIRNADHACCWESIWSTALASLP